MKKNRKISDKFNYPHPIIRSFTSIPQESQQLSPYAYQNFHTDNPNTISNKLLRCTHTQPLLGSSFSLLLHPLHPGLDIPVYPNSHILKCPKCKSPLNSISLQKLSLIQYRCRFCQQLIEMQGGIQRYADASVMDVINDGVGNQDEEEGNGRKVLFVIQASQFLYKKNIVTGIFQCLKAMMPMVETPQFNKSISQETQQTENERKQEANSLQTLKVGFILFDNQRTYILNMQNLQLVVINPDQFTIPTQLPLAQHQIVQSLAFINLEQVQSIIHELMYESFMIKTTCLIPTLKLCDMLANIWQIQTRMFALSYDHTMLERKKVKGKSANMANSLVVSPFVQINVFDYGLFSDMSSMGLSRNLCRYYEYSKISHTDIYYNLYHNLTQETEYNTTVTISTSKMITCAKNIQQVPIINSNKTLILDFLIPNKGKRQQISSLEKKEQFMSQCVQIRLKFAKYERIITYQLPKIGTNLYNQPYLLNDETFFYVMVSKFLNDPSISSIKKAINLKCMEIINRILNNDNDQFEIPRNLINFFMYTFVMAQHDVCEKKNVLYMAEKHQFLSEGLETITKKLYPKTYEFYPELKSLRFRPKSFLHNSIRLVDNGTSITLVIGDQISPSTLTNLLNITDIDIALDWMDIPVLNTDINIRLRQAISLLRQLNQMYHLPLRIIRFDSRQFEEWFGNFLYMEEDHRQFFKKLVRQ